MEAISMQLQHRILLPFVLLVCVNAQPADTLVSPEIESDRRVTFRMRAPKASEVALAGDWMSPGSQKPMKKTADGVWAISEGPMDVGMYIYNFVVDGVAIADPVNPRMKLRSRTSASLVEVSGDKPAFWQLRDVPHGSVEINWQKSKTINGETRPIWVYTPPGYEKSGNRRYPVVYLLHGSNDTAAGWTTAGNANFIIDNLLAENKALPMIVVMPYTHAVPFGSPREVQAKNTPLFEKYLMEDVMPFAESKYRIAKGSNNQALVGLSMGGGHSLNIGLSHLGMFHTVGVFSSAPGPDFETKFADILKNPNQANSKIKQFYIGCGLQDPVIARATKLSETLKAHNIRHTFRTMEGLHTYTVWRTFLNEVAPLMFR